MPLVRDTLSVLFDLPSSCSHQRLDRELHMACSSSSQQSQASTLPHKSPSPATYTTGQQLLSGPCSQKPWTFFSSMPVASPLSCHQARASRCLSSPFFSFFLFLLVSHECGNHQRWAMVHCIAMGSMASQRCRVGPPLHRVVYTAFLDRARRGARVGGE